MLAATSGQRVLALAVEHGADIFVRAAPLWPAVAAAAADPHVEHYWRGVAADRRAGQARMVARLAELGVLRDGLDPDRATDLVVVLFGHDVFTGLVTQSRMERAGVQGVAAHHPGPTAAAAAQAGSHCLRRPVLQ